MFDVEFSFLKSACLSVLNSCAPKGYALAGRNIFYDLWARDFCYASPGLLKAGRAGLVDRNFRLLFKFQKSDGELPNILSQTPPNFWGLLLSFPVIDVRKRDLFPLMPRYKNINGFEDLDSTMLCVIYYAEFLKSFGGLKHYSKLKRACD